MNRIDRTLAKILSDPAKRRAWVIFQLQLQGRSLAAVAREAGVRRQTIYHAFTSPYPRMEQVIADAVGLSAQQLWPERYGADGLPHPRGSSRMSCHGVKHKPHRRTARNTQMRGAA